MQPMVNIALRAARQAGEMIVKAADNLDSVKVDEKGRHDFVTEVDRRSEELIIEQIKKIVSDIEKKVQRKREDVRVENVEERFTL